MIVAAARRLPRRSPFPGAALALVALFATVAHAAPLDLQVAVRGDRAEIGKDLVLDLMVAPPPETALVVDGVTVEVSAADGGGAFGSPYAPRVTAAAGGALQVEWAAPVPADADPRLLAVTVDVTARDAAGATYAATWSGDVAVEFGDEWSADRIQAFIERRGYGFFLALVFGFGLLMSLSPCIYPMIPITLAVIGARSQDKGAAHGLLMSVTYVVGMALVYAVLGALSATVFSGITAFMQSPVVLVPLALLLLALSFSMFGAYELQAPAFLRDRLAGPGGSRGGLLGVFAMGLVAGLVASPCVGPFLAALLVWVGTTGNWVLGFFSLFTFGLGMGMLLIGVGTFPALMGSMPRSGGWMETVKKAMGLLLVAMAFYFVRPGAVLPAKVFYPLAGVAVILTSVFMGAFDRLSTESGWWSRTTKGLGLAAFAVGLWMLMGSLVSQGAFLAGPSADARAVALERVATHGAPTRAAPAVDSATSGAPATTAAAAPAADHVAWQKIATGQNVRAFLDEQRSAARAAGRPVMIDFWAEWCIYCKKLDKLVWKEPSVVAAAQRFVTIKIDATAPDDEEMEAIKEEFQVPGLPRVIFIDSRGEVLHGRSSGFKTADEMLAVMQGIR